MVTFPVTLVVFTQAINIDRSEIRTRATEVTGALNQRLRPLGHPALLRAAIGNVNIAQKNDAFLKKVQNDPKHSA